jgi:site-specific recombinase XerD
MNKVVNISSRVFPISVRSLREAFDKALRKARIEDFHFHDLRHTFATRLVQNGVDIYKVKELLGSIIHDFSDGGNLFIKKSIYGNSGIIVVPMF